MTLFNCCDGPTDIYLFHFSSFASLRSKRFRAVSEQGSREKWLSFHFSRGQNRESRSSVFLCSETPRKRLLRRLLICKKVILTDKRIWARDLSQMTRSKKQKTNELHVKWLKRWKSIYKYFLITGYTCIFFWPADLTIVRRGDWLWMEANIKDKNNGLAVYVVWKLLRRFYWSIWSR